MSTSQSGIILWFEPEPIISQIVPRHELRVALGYRAYPAVILALSSQYPCPTPFQVFETNNFPKWSFWEYIPGSCPLALLPTVLFPQPLRGAVALVIDSMNTDLEGTGVLYKQRQHLASIIHTTRQLGVPLLLVCLRTGEDGSTEQALVGDIDNTHNVDIVYFKRDEMTVISEAIQHSFSSTG